MKIIKILNKFFNYIKSLFKRNTFLNDDDFLQIFKKSNELIHCLYDGDRKSVIKVRLLKECISRMLLTEEPDVFAAEYQNAVELAEEVALECSRNSKDNAEELLSMLNGLPRGFEASEKEICYKVTFRSRRKTYCYLSGKKAYRIGQHVLAPAGDDMKICVVRIVGKVKLEESDIIFPIAELKSIFGPALY